MMFPFGAVVLLLLGASLGHVEVVDGLLAKSRGEVVCRSYHLVVASAFCAGLSGVAKAKSAKVAKEKSAKVAKEKSAKVAKEKSAKVAKVKTAKAVAVVASANVQFSSVQVVAKQSVADTTSTTAPNTEGAIFDGGESFRLAAPVDTNTTTGWPCIFPFTYGGVTYTSCTTVDNGGTPWCATDVDSNGAYSGGSGEWGPCDLGVASASTGEYKIKGPSKTTRNTNISDWSMFLAAVIVAAAAVALNARRQRRQAEGITNTSDASMGGLLDDVAKKKTYSTFSQADADESAECDEPASLITNKSTKRLSPRRGFRSPDAYENPMFEGTPGTDGIVSSEDSLPMAKVCNSDSAVLDNKQANGYVRNTQTLHL